MSFASQADSRKRNNDALLKKKRYFDFHQDIIQKYFLKGSKKKNVRKQLTAKQVQHIRRDLEFERSKESGRKIFVLFISIIVTLVILFLIVFTEYVF